MFEGRFMNFIEMTGKTLKRVINEDEITPAQLHDCGVDDDSLVRVNRQGDIELRRRDTWDVIGLAGTGSKTLVLDNVLVPEHRVVLFADAAAGQTPGSRLNQNRLYAVPIYSHVSACLAATAVGAAAGAAAASSYSSSCYYPPYYCYPPAYYQPPAW